MRLFNQLVVFAGLLSRAKSAEVNLAVEGPVVVPKNGQARLHDVDALSWVAPRVYQYPNFLSEEECDYLIALALAQPAFTQAQAGHHKTLTSVYAPWEAAQSDPVIASIEKRIGVVTGGFARCAFGCSNCSGENSKGTTDEFSYYPPGILPHDDEEPICLHRIRPLEATEGGSVAPWAENRTSCRGDTSTCRRSVTGVHHDKVGNPLQWH